MKLKDDNTNHHVSDMTMYETLNNDVKRLVKENEQLCVLNEEQRRKLNEVAVERNGVLCCLRVRLKW